MFVGGGRGTSDNTASTAAMFGPSVAVHFGKPRGSRVLFDCNRWVPTATDLVQVIRLTLPGQVLICPRTEEAVGGEVPRASSSSP